MSSAPIPFPAVQSDNARNSIPATNLGWYPQAPGHVGTDLNGLPYSSPLGDSTTNVEYTDEDYSTHHNAVVTGQLFLKEANQLPGPDTTGKTPAETKFIDETYRTYCTEKTGGQGLLANVGELIFTYAPATEVLSTDPEEFDIVEKIAMPASDENSVSTQALTVPQINKYLTEFGRIRWSLEDVMKLVDTLHFYGVLRAVGPGENALDEKNVKSYVCVCERVVLATDIWGATGGRRIPQVTYLYVELRADQTGADEFRSLRVRPFHTIDHRVASARLLAPMYVDPEDGNTCVLFHWFIGTFRSVQTPRSHSKGGKASVSAYVRGNSALQQDMPIAEICVGL